MKKIASLIFLLSALVLFPRCTDKNNSVSTFSEGLSITQILPKNIVTGDTVAITGTGLQDVTAVIFPGGIPATSFTLVGLNQISAVAPAGITNGYITLKTANNELKAPMQIYAVVPSYSMLFPDTAKIGAQITIVGTNLLEIQKIIFPDNVVVSDIYFNRKSDTQISVNIPAGASIGTGMIKMVTLSDSIINLGNVDIQSAAYIPVTLSYVFYEDAVMNGWNEWGWNRNADYSNKDYVLTGAYSMKVDFTGQWGGIAFQSGDVQTAPYTELDYSVYGGPGTDGYVLNVKLNWNDPSVNDTIKEGQWSHFSIPLSKLYQTSDITVLLLGNTTWTGTVYFDHIGLK